jgi:hypothetical protein
MPLPLGMNSITVGTGSDIDTLSPVDTVEVTEVFTDERACAVTLDDPVEVQLCEADVVPAASHPELVPSPQLIRYCTALPRLSTEPPVEYVYGVPATPLAVPLGTLGVDTVSPDGVSAIDALAEFDELPSAVAVTTAVCELDMEAGAV